MSENLISCICYSLTRQFAYSEVLITDNIMGFQKQNLILSNLHSVSYINLIIVSSEISGIFFSISSNCYFSLMNYPVCNNLEISSIINVETEIDFLNYTNNIRISRNYL